MTIRRIDAGGAARLTGAAIVALGLGLTSVYAQTVDVFGHRYPHNEFYMGEAMTDAVPGARIVPHFSSFAQFQEKVRIGLSAKSDELDIIACQGAKVLEHAKAGWLEPIDDLWEKYRQEYNLDDIPKNVVDTMRYEGKLYAVPFGMNTMFFFYRKDLFAEKGVQPPKTMKEYLELAKLFHTPRRSGTQLSMAMVETGVNQLNWHFNSHGPGWLDEKTFKPIFNGPHGVEAVETLKELAKYSAPGYLSNGNNEAMVNFQQDLTVMGLQWASRAAAMDDPEKSRVVGKIDYAVPAGGGSRVIVIGFCLPKFSDVDRETRFKILMEAAKPDKMKIGGAFTIPTRTSVLSDSEVQKNNRHYQAALETIKVAKDVPPLPEYSEVGEFFVRRVHQAMTGELEVKEALDLAAGEVTEHLRKRGYNPQ